MGTAPQLNSKGSAQSIREDISLEYVLKWVFPFITLFTSITAPYYAFNVIVTPLGQLFGPDNEEQTANAGPGTLCIVLGSLATVPTNYIVGVLFGIGVRPRSVALAATAAGATGLGLASLGAHTKQLWLVAIGFGGGIGVAVGSAYMTLVFICKQWFAACSHMGLGIGMLGMMIGLWAAAFAAVTQHLTERFSVAATFLIEAGWVLLVCGISAWRITSPPPPPAASTAEQTSKEGPSKEEQPPPSAASTLPEVPATAPTHPCDRPTRPDPREGSRPARQPSQKKLAEGSISFASVTEISHADAFSASGRLASRSFQSVSAAERGEATVTRAESEQGASSAEHRRSSARRRSTLSALTESLPSLSEVHQAMDESRGVLMRAKFWLFYVAILGALMPGFGFKMLSSSILDAYFSTSPTYDVAVSAGGLVLYSLSRLTFGILSERLPVLRIWTSLLFLQTVLLIIVLSVDVVKPPDGKTTYTAGDLKVALFTVLEMGVMLCFASLKTLWPLCVFALWTTPSEKRLLPHVIGNTGTAFGIAGAIGPLVYWATLNGDSQYWASFAMVVVQAFPIVVMTRWVVLPYVREACGWRCVRVAR